MDSSRRRIRVLMVPWLAHGHISPFLELARSLANRDFSSYIASSPVNLSSIRKRLSEDDSVWIKLVDLPIPASSELPPHHHTTNGLPPHLMPVLKKEFDRARPGFSSLLRTVKPDLVIYDFLQPWVPEEAEKLNIPAVLLLSLSAASSSFLMHFWLEEPKSEEYPFPAIHFRESELSRYRSRVESTDTNDGERVRRCVHGSSDIVLIKTSRELEGKYIDFLTSLMQKKVVPIGPLVKNVEIAENEDNTDSIRWLDRKDKGSTVFVSFGSEYFLTKDETEEIAFGLELSGVNFVWVIRFPERREMKIQEALPKGFLERSVEGERGLVLEGWVPQARILAHPSIGGFVSHCGWSSVMEGIHFCVPIIALPMHLDQPLNARLVGEVGLGEEVGGNLEREEVARVIRKVVMEESGEKIRWRMRELSGKLRQKGGEEIDEVEAEFEKLCSRRRNHGLHENLSNTTSETHD